MVERKDVNRKDVSGVMNKDAKKIDTTSDVSNLTEDEKNNKPLIQNIREEKDGLHFDLKISADENKVMEDLFISKTFYGRPNDFEIKEAPKVKMTIGKIALFKYIIIYFAAVLSLIIIVNGLMRISPIIKSFFKV